MTCFLTISPATMFTEYGEEEPAAVKEASNSGITFVEHDLVINSTVEHCAAVEVITGKKRKESTFVVNVYSNPAHNRQRFRVLLHKASRIAGSNTLVVCGDFNALSHKWGYVKTTVKGRELMQDPTDVGLHLVTDPAFPTRTGPSVTRDTTLDLLFVKIGVACAREALWRNTGEGLGSDYLVVEVTVPLSGNGNYGKRKHKITDWGAFRRALPDEQPDIEDIEKWTDAVTKTAEEATTEIQTDDNIDRMDSRLAHLLEAKKTLKKRWLKQRTNRRLRKKIAERNKQIEKHCRVLGAQQWNKAYNEADGQMAVQELGEDEVKKRLDAKHLPTTLKENHPGYRGKENATLDRDIETWEVCDALQNLNRRSAAGPDRVTNKAFRNLNDAAVEALTKYFNKCWRAGHIPKQWKTAKTILSPKPGKSPAIENLRPISLTSCAGKVLEHVLMD
ncbi:uncharacterized protein LOC144174415 [Haemaphysalis longicornis]